MAKVHIDQLEEGMILSTDVVTMNGQLLLKEGVTVTARHANIFRQWGINEIHIQGDAPEIEAGDGGIDELADDLRTEVENRVETLFQNVTVQHKVVDLLKKYATQAIIKEVRGD